MSPFWSSLQLGLELICVRQSTNMSTIHDAIAYSSALGDVYRIFVQGRKHCSEVRQPVLKPSLMLVIWYSCWLHPQLGLGLRFNSPRSI